MLLAIKIIIKIVGEIYIYLIAGYLECNTLTVAL